MPYDGDLKTNLAYARSLVGTSTTDAPPKNPVVTFIKTLFRDFNFNAIAVFALLIYLSFIALQIAGIFDPVLAKRTRAVSVVVFLIFAVSAGGFAIRYYDAAVLKHGVVVKNNLECRYEPIDKSTIYYKLQEGDEVLVLKTRNLWRQVRRSDGKIGWVNAAGVEEI